MKLLYTLLFAIVFGMQPVNAQDHFSPSFEEFRRSISGQEAGISLDEYKELYHLFFDGVTAVTTPELLIFAGGPGAGKTTYRKEHFADQKNYHIHDMDEVITRLKGYQEDLKTHGPKVAFENWWPTAQKVANQFVQYALSSKLNVMYDRTCGTETSLNDLRNAIEKLGYKAQMFAFSLPDDEAIRRVHIREETEGRTVTDEIVKEYARRFSALFPKYREFIPDIDLFVDSDKVFSQDQFRPSVYNKPLYNKFLILGQQA